MSDLDTLNEELSFEPKTEDEKFNQKVNDQKIKSEEEAFSNHVQISMKEPACRSLIRFMVGESFILNGTFTENPQALAFREGTRNSALRMLSKIKKHDPKGFQLLWKEIGEDL